MSTSMPITGTWAVLPIQFMSKNKPLTPIFTDAGGDDGDTFVNDGNTFLYVKNTNVSVSRTIQIKSLKDCDQEHNHDISHEIPASGEKIIGFTDVSRFCDYYNRTYVTYSDNSDVGVAVIRIYGDREVPVIPANGGLALATGQTAEHTLHVLSASNSLVGSFSVGSDVLYTSFPAGGVQCVFDYTNYNAYFIWRNNLTPTTTHIIRMNSSGDVSSELNITTHADTSKIPRIALSKDGIKLYCYYNNPHPDSEYYLATIDTSSMTITDTIDTGQTFGGSDSNQRMLANSNGFLYSSNGFNKIVKFSDDFITNYEVSISSLDIALDHVSPNPTLYARGAAEIFKSVDNGSSWGTPTSIISGLGWSNFGVGLTIWDSKLITIDAVSTTVNNLEMYDFSGTLIDSLSLGGLNIHGIVTGMSVRDNYLYFTAYDNIGAEYNIYRSLLNSTTIGTPVVFYKGKGNFCKAQDWLGDYNNKL